MALRFTKMHGLGNDFVVIDATREKGILPAEMIQKLADRRTGIGFDQLLLIEPSKSNQFDFTYRIFNADGKEVEQCGNGARCVAHYIFSENLSTKKNLILQTVAGKVELTKEADGQITVNMGQPQFVPEQIPFVTARQALHYELPLDGNTIQFGAVSLGNPHAVLEVKDVVKAPVQQIGQLLQQHSAFPRQVNVGFMEIVAKDYIRLRVFERGVGETLSCGSGACAAVVIGRKRNQLADQVTVELPGGSLVVRWNNGENEVFLTGPAEKVFKGELA